MAEHYVHQGRQNPGMSPVSDDYDPHDVIRKQPMHGSRELYGSRDLHGSRDMAAALGRHDISLEKEARPWVRGSLYLSIVVCLFCSPPFGLIGIILAVVGMRSTSQEQAKKMMLVSAIVSAVGIGLTILCTLALVGLYASRAFDIYNPRY